MKINFKNIINVHVIFLIIIFLLLNFNILSNFIWKLPINFADFKMPINWLECYNSGYNLFTIEEINCGTNKNISQFNYGKAFLHIPYNELLDKFYRFILPWLLIYLFVIFTVQILDPKKITEEFLLYLAILNPSTLLMLERMQLDCIFYLAIILSIYNRYFIINWSLGLYFALIKFYPIAILTTIFVENKKRNLKTTFLIILFLSILYFGYLLINKEYYSFMLNNMLPGKAGYHFLFSLNTLPKVFKYVFSIKYQLLLLIFYSLFIYLTILIINKINKEQKNTKIIRESLFSKESKLFFISGYFNLFLFLLVSSYAYKEIYLILSIPYIIWLKKNNDSIIFKILYYTIFFRFLFLYIYSYININDGIIFENGIRIFSNYFLITISIKGFIDFILLSMVFSILYIKTIIYLKNMIKKV